MVHWVFVATLFLSLTAVPIRGWDDTNLVSRKDWGAVPVKPDCSITKYPKKPTLVVVHHTGTDPCSNRETCIAKVQYIQKSHIETYRYCDIGYNFLVGGDGLIYEGRGFDVVGAHTMGYNTETLGFAFLGSFEDQTPTPDQVKRALEFLENAAKQGSLPSNFKIAGANQLVATISPGNNLMKIVKTWNRFTNDPKKWLGTNV